MTEKRVGLIIGREWSWPSALMTEVNSRDAGVRAELVKLSGVTLGEPVDYAVIIDRMSHDVPFYRSYVKYAALQGVDVINDPFTVAVDDKFFGLALLNRLGLAYPRTIILPNKTVETENVPESFRNLSYPLDWKGIIDHVGVPSIFKDASTGGRRIVFRVFSVDGLIDRYDESHTLTMILQEIVPAEQHIHCFVVGGENVHSLQYTLDGASYDRGPLALEPPLLERLEEDARRISRTYGYDINMVEFVLSEGEPVVINPSNPTPDLDINLIGATAFRWSIDKVATLVIERALRERARPPHRPWLTGTTEA